MFMETDKSQDWQVSQQVSWQAGDPGELMG